MAQLKQIEEVLNIPAQHWVGDGFPVRTLFTYDNYGEALSPFLLFDFAGPMEFPPASRPRGVGQHPHRGFETVTIVYEGEVDHKDLAGNSGHLKPGDVQWMTAASGIVHQEFHSQSFTEQGGTFHAVQLWVNLPAKDKMSPPRYQDIPSSRIPTVAVNGGKLRVIAGEYDGTRGPALTFTPINIWDITIPAGGKMELTVPSGHNTAVVPVTGSVELNQNKTAKTAQLVRFTREGKAVHLSAQGEARLLLLSGEPIAEPIAGQGPFVMNTEAELVQAFDDYRKGLMG
ncbi:redox-sensitive bicupin YhaK (pirin superfamily) [Nitrospina gracilis Nb-211]|nr:pirin family protein [Nitrospina gracilis]MCF8721109.1 redox-sensitive bicupin YhaK (pirin superfamily) [Nitrospina gracilis Nb-211]